MFVWRLSRLISERAECLATNQFILNENRKEYIIFVFGIYRVLDNNDEDIFIFFIVAYLFLIDRSVLLILLRLA